MEFQLKKGTLRLEAVFPGVIRCVETLGAPVASPSGLIEPWEGAEPVIFPDGISCGNLRAAYDLSTDKITWSEADTGKTLLKEAGHELSAQPVIRYTTGDEAPVIQRVKTVDGERNFIQNLKPLQDRIACRAKLCFDFFEDEGIYGLGQGEDGIWNHRHTNEYLYQHNMRIPMPFFMSDRGYGVLVDCGSLMTFQDDARGSYLFLDTVSQLDYYVIIGEGEKRCDAIIHALRRLTGRAPLLPKWAFGYIQSKERYETAKELSDVVRRYRKLGVPLDGVVQDWHTWREEHWGEKRLDPERFGDLRERMDEIHQMHAHAMVSVWPNMNQNTLDYAEFEKAGYLLNDLSTYDAFNPEARAMYWKQAKAELFNGGFDAWWCDSTEPFSGPDWGGEVLREPWERYQLVGGEHKKYIDPAKANCFAVAHARGIYEHQRRDAPEKRVLNLTRSGYISSQRYGAVLWSGDICARWDVMKKQIAEALSMAASGYPWWTLDIGGFFVVHENWRGRGCGCNEDPTPKWFWRGDYEQGVEDDDYKELYVRWLQFGAFLPMFRSHGTDTPREIWHFGKKGEPYYDAIESAINLRYRLMPYIYSLAGGVWLDNGVMVRPLLFDFPEDPHAVSNDREYMFGPSLLVCPVTEPSVTQWDCYLPKGCDWIDFHTGEHYKGGQTVTVEAPLSRLPLFAKAGSIIPMCEGGQYADEPSKMEIKVYPGADADFTLYEDAGDGYAFESGEYTLTHYHWDDKMGTLREYQ